MTRSIAAALALVTLAAFSAVQAEELGGAALLKALQGGGYVLVMRHANSPQARPSDADADPDNLGHERQLDDAGRRTAAALGTAIKAIHIPIGEIWSSPTYRARETVRLAGLPVPRTAEELGDSGKSMQAASGAQAAWLVDKASQPPPAGTDTLIVTHSPNIDAAFGAAAVGLGDGELLVFHPDGRRPPAPVARFTIEEWR